MSGVARSCNQGTVQYAPSETCGRLANGSTRPYSASAVPEMLSVARRWSFSLELWLNVAERHNEVARAVER
jgi:hypothetical protein